MSHDIPAGTPVVIDRPLMPYDRRTGTVTAHVWRENQPAYEIALDVPAGAVGSVVIHARHLKVLPGPDVETPGEQT